MTSLSRKTRRALVAFSHAAYLLVGVTAASALAAQPGSSEAVGDDYAEGWWRHIRQATWIWSGADWSVVKPALARIQQATGDRKYAGKYDTIINHGPGHWAYEWSAIGEAAYQQGLKFEAAGDRSAALESLLESSLYYTQASYPHTDDEYSRAALEKAFAMYQRAGSHLEVPLERWEFEVDGITFPAMVHLPAEVAKQAVPVLLKTGGMDVLSTEYYPLAERLMDSGVAMIAFDSPGTGNDGVVDANYEKHHEAVLERVWKDKRFDNQRIAVWSDSLAGSLPVKLAVGEHRDRIAAAINGCGIVHAAFNLDLLGGPSNTDKLKLVQAYQSGKLSQQEIDGFLHAAESPQAQALSANFQSQIFVERLGADPTNLLDLLAKAMPVSLINQGVLGEKNITNTPILVINTHADPLVPDEESRLAADASVQGKLMIIDDYQGHCVSRAEFPLVLEWLSYHLGEKRLGGVVDANRKTRKTEKPGYALHGNK